MPELRSLPGTNGKPKTIKEFANSPSGFIRLLKRDGFSTGANDNGAINVWKDDAGSYRAERHYRLSVRDGIITKVLKELKVWLDVNYPKIL